jgi:hypothetical protein
MVSNTDINRDIEFILFQHIESNILRQNEAYGKLNSIDFEKYKKKSLIHFKVIISFISISSLLIIICIFKLLKKK